MKFAYPIDGATLLKKRRALKRELASDGSPRISKKIAVLCGSTANDVVDMLDLFLLDDGIAPAFYVSEYNMYAQEGMFPSAELLEFKPDIAYIHTTHRNISQFDDPQAEFTRFRAVWDGITANLSCVIIQNNFDSPAYRLLGNRDCYDSGGRLYFINKLNMMFADYAQQSGGFEAGSAIYINDINFTAARYGLDRWHDAACWNAYKYAMATAAVPDFAWNLSRIVKSVFGRNKKAFCIDLDNTLWGGIVGEGVEGIELGEETPAGQCYADFQRYVASHRAIGVPLTVDSKNDYDNAVAGLNHVNSHIKPEQLAALKANWNPKNENLREIAAEMSLLPESFVFVDDNPAEREIIKQTFPGAAVPDVSDVEDFIRVIDRNGWFEVTKLTDDDRARAAMYEQNAARTAAQSTYTDYGAYLDSLGMTAVITPFKPVDYARITQLTNKSNQFNVTTKRYTEPETARVATDSAYITLCGRLADKFWDNGVVAVVVGAIDSGDSTVLDIELWLMSCRVLKRGMENAMLDILAAACIGRGIKTIRGHYYPTKKNGMVRELFGELGFTKLSCDDLGNSLWELNTAGYVGTNMHIEVT